MFRIKTFLIKTFLFFFFVFFITDERFVFRDPKTGQRLHPQFGVSKSVSAGLRRNGLVRHEGSLMHKIASNEITLADLNFAVKSYIGMKIRAPAVSHARLLYGDYMLDIDIGKIQHTSRARNNFLIVANMETNSYVMLFLSCSLCFSFIFCFFFRHNRIGQHCIKIKEMDDIWIGCRKRSCKRITSY